ncbi:MAG: hypothetical protein RI967_534 [Planctomycetota bacterium]
MRPWRAGPTHRVSASRGVDVRIRRIFPRILAAGLVAGAACAIHAEGAPLGGTARAADDDAPPSHRAARGTAGSIRVTHAAGALRAKPVRDANATVLVRVRQADDGAPDAFTIEFLGAVEGTFDLLPLLETTDGRAPDAAALGDLRVAIYSQLPPVHGTDVFGLSAPGFDLRASYTPIVGTVVAAWLAVPVIALVRRWMRTPPPPPAPPAPPPTAAERLLAELETLDARLAHGEAPDADARGRIELLLLRVLRERAPDLADGRDDGAMPDPARTLARLRDDPRTAGIVRAVEAWLHAPGPRDARAVAGALAVGIRNAATASPAEGGGA